MSHAWDQLISWKEKDFISDLECEFVRFLKTLNTELPDEVLYAASACIFAQRNGHLCLDLNQPDEETYLFGEAETNIVLDKDTYSTWLQSLSECNLVSEGQDLQPLVLEEGRLYLQRFWSYEEEFCNWIREKAGVTHSLSEEVIQVIRKLLPPSGDLFEVNWQDVAVVLSFLKDLVVITGGPGTGKTHTVLSIIAAHSYLHDQESFHIALAAPTGKAARRLIESIEEGSKKLPETVKEKIQLPKTALTVHKLLGAGFRGNSFTYNQQNPLPHQLVVVDEASMLDINLWVRLTKAIGPNTKLIVLGDKDQLASVEAGSILGDICQGENTFSSSITDAIEKVSGGTIKVQKNAPPINDCVVFLTKSYRFGEDSGIHKLSKAINASDFEGALSVLKDKSYQDVTWMPYSAENIKQVVRDFGIQHYQSYSSPDFSKLMTIASQKKILCAIRKSPVGVEELNSRIEQGIKRDLGILQNNRWFHGRQIMATRNDAVTKIKNGEIGLYNESQNKVVFEGEHQSQITPARLQHFEKAFAITIHKSQGSEFKDVAIMLPNAMNSVLSKEILYTAVTRARQNTLVVANKDVLRQTIAHSVQRNSGVKQKIWK